MTDSKKSTHKEDATKQENDDSEVDFEIESEDWDDDWEGVEIDDSNELTDEDE